jgi:hypothetical protein
MRERDMYQGISSNLGKLHLSFDQDGKDLIPSVPKTGQENVLGIVEVVLGWDIVVTDPISDIAMDRT